MTGLAAGMALDGRIVFTYSIANFPTLRCLEQIRNDAAYHDANVKIVSIGGGFSYGVLGMSHHATEDLAIMRSIPSVTVASPGCLWEVEAVTEALSTRPAPAICGWTNPTPEILGRRRRIFSSERFARSGRATMVRFSRPAAL